MNNNMPQDEEMFEDELDAELAEDAEQVKKAPSKGKPDNANPEKVEEVAQERYQAFVVPERFGIMDNVTNEPAVIAEKQPTISEIDIIKLQSEAKAMNDREKIIVGGGFN